MMNANDAEASPVDLTVRPLREKHARMMALLLDEAAANLAALMDTPQADALGVRHFLPDELSGCAIMLRDAYGLPAAANCATAAEGCGLPSQRSIAIGKDEAYSRPATDAQGIGDPLDEGKAADESETREAARCGS